MGTIKGQNLRVLVEDKCVAAATNCQVHIAVQLAETSTKDTEGSWQEQEPVDKAWDGSVDALVTDGVYDAASLECDIEIAGGGGEAYKAARQFKLAPGQTFWVSADDTVFVMGDNSPLSEPASGNTHYTNNGSTTINVYGACLTEGGEVDVYITDAARATCNKLLTAFFAGQPVGIRFSVTGGRNNIVESDALLEGEAYISDLQLTAQNKAVGQFTMSFTGTGELERVVE